jgi:hypothetical protein
MAANSQTSPLPDPLPAAPAAAHADRAFLREVRRYDVVVAGGGMAGIGAAVTAARHGARVALVQDRPVLGGNGSKEIRVWLHGASGGANALWFRETGLMEELLIENQYRNPETNAELWDTILLDKVLGQKNLELHLNCSVVAVRRSGARLESITGVNTNAERQTVCEAEFFIDCTGDGTVGFLAGAPFMSGREGREEFNESLAPPQRQPHTLGSSILFHAKDVGHPVEFHPPAFACKFSAADFRPGRDPVPEFDQCRSGFWWVEWGGTLDTIHDNEAIKYELLRIAYGLFDYLKNDPSQREKNRNLTLEWVGCVPGKRESRRFVGDCVVTENDLRERTAFHDAVAYGGWNLDDHAPRGFHDDRFPPSTHTHIPGLYSLPLRCLYSREIENLFFAGRNISVTHVALTSTRVMLTCAQAGEATGAAAALCVQRKCPPRTLAAPENVAELQQRLLRDDHYIPGVRAQDPANLAGPAAAATASSQLPAPCLDRSARTCRLDRDRLVLFPAAAGALPDVQVLLDADSPTTLEWLLHRPDGRGGTFPVAVAAQGKLPLAPGRRQWVSIPVAASMQAGDWRMLELKKNPALAWHMSDTPLVGLMAFVERGPDSKRHRNEYSRFGKLGPGCYCVRLPPDERIYGPANVLNGCARPFLQPNLWVSKVTDFRQPEWLEVSWGKAALVREVLFFFDSGLNRHMVSIGDRAPYRVEPDLVRDYDVELREGGAWRKAREVRGNYHRRRAHAIEPPVAADAVRLVVRATNGTPRAQVYEVRVYG